MAALNEAGLAAILKGIGAPVTLNNLRTLVGWEKAEGGSASFNPFNTTLPEPGASSYNSVGVRNYTSEAQGIAATVSTLRGSAYSAVVADLRHGANPATIAAAVGASPWGTPDFAADIPGNIGRGTFPPGSSVTVTKGGITQAVEGAVSGPVSAAESVGSALGKLTDPSVWLSAGFVLLGLALLLMGTIRLFSGKVPNAARLAAVAAV
jgi:hypothetical protein